MKKKGLTKHHLCYGEKEIVVEIPSKGSHLILTSFQSMNPTKENIRLLKNFKRALNYIIKEKNEEYKIHQGRTKSNPSLQGNCPVVNCIIVNSNLF